MLAQPAMRVAFPDRASPMIDASPASNCNAMTCSGSITALTTWLL
jgi:hypothetical protein